jgi:glycosyltransferase involved in cell wall biosynthesis
MSANARVLFVCGREVTYVRNAFIWRTLQREFDATLVADNRPGSLSLRLARLIPRLIRALRVPHDLIVIGFYGHPLALLASRLSGAPILFDPFVSTYDTLVSDRGRVSPGSPVAAALHALDHRALAAATRVLADTQAHAAYYGATFGLAPDRVETLYLGCDPTFFAPRPDLQPSDARLEVFTYSTYLPLHGMSTVIQAAARCAPYPVHFTLVGNEGPTYRQVRQEADARGLDNVTFASSLPFADLPAAIARSHVCLGGHFGPSAKAGRVVAGKTYQFIAMGKPVILGDNPANRELFAHLDTAYLCPANQPDALAHAVLDLLARPDLRHNLGEQAYRRFRDGLTWEQLGARLTAIVRGMLG